MTLKRIGFFRELPHGRRDGPSLKDVQDRLAETEAVEIAHYLNAATVLAATGSLADDALDPTCKGIAPLEIATDGDWVWPRDLGYYVSQYRVEVPREFIEHVRERNGEPPMLDRGALQRVETQFFVQS